MYAYSFIKYISQFKPIANINLDIKCLFLIRSFHIWFVRMLEGPPSEVLSETTGNNTGWTRSVFLHNTYRRENQIGNTKCLFLIESPQVWFVRMLRDHNSHGYSDKDGWTRNICIFHYQNPFFSIPVAHSEKFLCWYRKPIQYYVMPILSSVE